MKKLPNIISEIVDELTDQYLFADETKHSWIIGFRGKIIR